MVGFFALFRRELSGHFTAPAAYIFMVCFLVGGSALGFYLGGFFERGQADLTPFFNFFPWLLLLLAPALAMNLWTDEYQSGTYELLVTLPLNTMAAVLAKFLAVWFFATVALLFSFPLWLSVNYLGTPDNGIIAVSYFATWLYTGVFLCWSGFCSALCRSQVSAFILGVVGCFLLLVSSLPLVLDSIAWLNSDLLLDAVASMSILHHNSVFLRGVVQLSSIWYFFMLMLSFLIATLALLNLRRINTKRAPIMVLLKPLLTVLVAVSFIVLASLHILLPNYWRMDVSEERMFSLTEATKSILEELPQPIEIELYFSYSLTEDYPSLRILARRSEGLLEEYERYAKGKLKVKVIDPLPFSEDEDAAGLLGLQGLPLGQRGNVFFGLVARNQRGQSEVIEFLAPARESFLEYDITRLIARLSLERPPVIGLLTTLPMEGGFNPMVGPTPPWVVNDYLGADYDIERLSPDMEHIPQQITTLLLVHPQELSNRALYAIDQFVLRGGRLLVFVDPHAETAGQDWRSSDLPKLFTAWGLEMVPDKVLLDADYALEVYNQNRSERNLALLGITDFPQGQVTTAQLELVTVSSAGVLKPKEGAITQFMPLLNSSQHAMLTESGTMVFMNQPEMLRDGFEVSGDSYVIGARIVGEAATAFPEGQPAAEELLEETPADTDASGDSDTGSDSGATTDSEIAEDVPSSLAPDDITTSDTVAPAPELPLHIESTDHIEVTVIADTDLLQDRLWLQLSSLFGRRMVQPWADNGNFFLNLVETMSGSPELMNIRSRGQFSRSFHRVDALRRQAEQNFWQEEQRLEEQLEITESRLAELQQNTPEGSTLELNPQLSEELFRFQMERLNIRKQLRHLRHQLDRDIEMLSDNLKLFNILVPPLLPALLAFLMWWRRRRQWNQVERQLS